MHKFFGISSPPMEQDFKPKILGTRAGDSPTGGEPGPKILRTRACELLFLEEPWSIIARNNEGMRGAFLAIEGFPKHPNPEKHIASPSLSYSYLGFLGLLQKDESQGLAPTIYGLGSCSTDKGRETKSDGGPGLRFVFLEERLDKIS